MPKELIEPHVNPLISVIIPIYNGEKFIENLLEQLVKQQYSPMEIIVVDDGSSDKTAQILAKYTHVNYFYQENKGPAAARNNGLQQAHGTFIAFLDCDDLWSETHLNTLIQHFNNNPKLDIVKGQIQEQTIINQSIENKELPYFNCLLGSCIIRKSTFNKIGYFDEELVFCEDMDWFTRAWENNVPLKKTNSISLYYRRHEHNMTNNVTRRTHYRMLYYKKKLQREKSTFKEKPITRYPLKEYLN